MLSMPTSSICTRQSRNSAAERMLATHERKHVEMRQRKSQAESSKHWPEYPCRLRDSHVFGPPPKVSGITWDYSTSGPRYFARRLCDGQDSHNQDSLTFGFHDCANAGQKLRFIDRRKVELHVLGRRCAFTSSSFGNQPISAPPGRMEVSAFSGRVQANMDVVLEEHCR